MPLWKTREACEKRKCNGRNVVYRVAVFDPDNFKSMGGKWGDSKDEIQKGDVGYIRITIAGKFTIELGTFDGGEHGDEWETYNEIDVFESHPETYSPIIAMKLEEIGLLMLRD